MSLCDDPVPSEWHLIHIEADGDEKMAVVYHPEGCPLSIDTTPPDGPWVEYRCQVAYEISNGGYGVFFEYHHMPPLVEPGTTLPPIGTWWKVRCGVSVIRGFEWTEYDSWGEAVEMLAVGGET